jgi:Uma2 family endonuclease
MTPDAPQLLTIEEYVRLPDDDRRTELVRGKVIERRFPYPFEGFICGNVGGAVGQYAEAHRLGRVTIDTGVVTARDPDTVRGADVCFYSFKRLPGPLPEEGYTAVAPDLVVEVWSPSNRWPKVMAKVTEYLEVGVTVVCVMIPRDRTAVIYRDNPTPETVAADADLTLPDVLPGFRVPLRQFFE